jgi:cytochrome c peroxidase
MRRVAFFTGLIVIAASACRKDDPPTPVVTPEIAVLQVPAGFPQPEIPADNALTPLRIALGKRLFYDPVLSRDSTLSCASCHKQHLAFADNVAASLGIEGRPGARNSPSLANVAYQKRLLREGGVPTLEMQILVPIQEHNEFDFNILNIMERLERMPEYVDLSWQAYGRKPDPFVITRAISAFERTLLSGDSPFDQWHFQGKTRALSAEAQRGFVLFNSERLGCNNCHTGFLFTNQEFANNGLYETYTDPGRMRLTGLESDRAVFKIPSLRNVAVTAPYMHDGSLKSLDEVINHYQTGGKPHPNKSKALRPFTLTTRERQELLAFLNSLTDLIFLQNPDLH